MTASGGSAPRRVGMLLRQGKHGMRRTDRNGADRLAQAFSRRRTPLQDLAETIPLGCDPTAVAAMPLTTVMDAIRCLDLYAAAAPRPLILAVRDLLADLQLAADRLAAGGDPPGGERLPPACGAGETVDSRADEALPRAAFAAAVAAFEAEAAAMLPLTPTAPMIKAGTEATGMTEEQVRTAYTAMACRFTGSRAA